jgi:putative ABC transport system substrate-binding protein
MRRRDFSTFLGGVIVAWPLAARAQQTERKRRIGVLNGMGETDPEVQDWDVAFRKRLDELGWVDGRNVNIDYRWAAGNVERMQLFAKELVRLNPDVIVSFSTPATAAVQAETRTIPIVFAAVADPVGSGFVATLAKPGGNITGFISVEGSLGSKWLQLLHDVAPQVSRVAFMYNPNTAPFAQYYLAPFQSAASKLAIDAIDARVHSPAEIEAVMNMISRRGNAGVIIMLDITVLANRELILSLADRYRLPAVYPQRSFVTGGGLISYGIEIADLFRNAGSYVDRILRGEKPNDLPIQLPTKFDLVINLKTAKTLGLTVPPTLLAVADEVIE